MKSKRFFFGVLAVVLFLSVGGYAFLKYLYPFGHRPCTLQCMALALRRYAQDHEGAFPSSDKSPLDALRKLYPDYVVGVELAGITGDRKILKSNLEGGEPLDSSATSWVYVPGLKVNDDANLAILWESKAGVLPNGRRARDQVHAVLFIELPIKLVPESEWDSFLKSQEALRKKVLEGRAGKGN